MSAVAAVVPANRAQLDRLEHLALTAKTAPMASLDLTDPTAKTPLPTILPSPRRSVSQPVRTHRPEGRVPRDRRGRTDLPETMLLELAPVEKARLDRPEPLDQLDPMVPLARKDPLETPARPRPPLDRQAHLDPPDPLDRLDHLDPLAPMAAVAAPDPLDPQVRPETPAPTGNPVSLDPPAPREHPVPLVPATSARLLAQLLVISGRIWHAGCDQTYSIATEDIKLDEPTVDTSYELILLAYFVFKAAQQSYVLKLI